MLPYELKLLSRLRDGGFGLTQPKFATPAPIGVLAVKAKTEPQNDLTQVAETITEESKKLFRKGAS